MYHIYCNRDGSIILDDDYKPLTIYVTKSDSNRNYYAFNHLDFKRVFVHRIVAYLYVEGYRKDLVVDHKDNNPFNDDFTNLQYLTSQQNTAKECGKTCELYNVNTRQILSFNSKSECCRYFNISTSSLNILMKEYLNSNLPYYIFKQKYLTKLLYLINDYLDGELYSAATTALNMRDMIEEGWFVLSWTA